MSKEINNEIDELKPQTLEQRIKEAYPDYKVEMCKWDDNHWRFDDGICKWNHHFAQSMRGFYRYVYEDHLDEALFDDTRTTIPWRDEKTILPVAVLFEVAK